MLVNSRFKISIVLIGMLLAAPLFAQENTKPPKLFSDTSEMKVTLSGPWRTVRNNIKKDALYPVQLTYMGADGKQHTIDAEVAPRGITRRLRVCDFPPLKIHFDKEKTKDTEFRGNKSLKLVTYCNTHNKYEQYYIKEFLTYRIYNLITEYSFRVRPMIVEYKDNQSKKWSISRFSFLVEDLDDVAERNDLKKLAVAKISYRTLDPVETGKLGLFQFMVGNVDFATNEGPEDDSCCHNTKLIGTGDYSTPKYSIPYDFDSTGLVDAHYAFAPTQLKLRSVRQRLYRGFCLANDELPETIALFNTKRPDILDLFRNDTHLTDHNRKKAIKYIEDFYKIINDPKALKKEITDKCRGSAL
jgi:hypothetical protein